MTAHCGRRVIRIFTVRSSVENKTRFASESVRSVPCRNALAGVEASVKCIEPPKRWQPKSLRTLRKNVTIVDGWQLSQTLRVLIVDDEASQRAGLAGMVNAWGMAAETASEGAEALEKLAKIPVDVILTDLNMPGMDG